MCGSRQPGVVELPKRTGVPLILDCTDQERRQRLSSDAWPDEIEAALTDARRYRSPGLPVIDATTRHHSRSPRT